MPNSNTRHHIPLMPLREVVMFPQSIVPLFVGRESSIKAIEYAIERCDREILLVTQKDSSVSQPEKDDLFSIGTVSRVLQLLKLPDGTIKVLFEGLHRASWEIESSPRKTAETKKNEEITKAAEADKQEVAEADKQDVAHKPDETAQAEEAEITLTKVTMLSEIEADQQESTALQRAVLDSLHAYAQLNKKITTDILQSIASLTDASKLADGIAPHIRVDFLKKQNILEELSSSSRLELIYELLQSEIAIAGIEKSIKDRVKVQMEKNQREYYLNEQMKAIHKEMGREDDPSAELDELEKSIQSKPMPQEAMEKALKEIKKLHHIPTSSAEHSVLRTYVDWLLDLPWESYAETAIDIAQARNILDTDHFGLEKPKERILEYLAVQKLSTKLKGPILCFVGPPGVGKTSLAKSVAKATGREFIRLSLGGVRDEAEIRGHRRTYVGALPGKIIQSLKRVSHSNPLFCLDEIDKMNADFRGDPSAALLEVLDPEQNSTFNDHYLDLDYDLSKVFFITTANSLHSIPLPLQDRMEIITLPGYLETEKKSIARNYLLPKQIESHGLLPENLSLSDKAMTEIVRSYTKEAGVRNLEREIATICRKTAMQMVTTEDTKKFVTVTRQNLSHFLGVKKYRHGERESESQVGVCMGLAYTELGGEMLLVETALMHGSGKVNITGKLGDVMTESAQAALSYVRSRSDMLGLKPDFHKDIDIHIHVPEGATPKDGPSAGITLATSLVSALLGIPVQNDVAMTGEITLRGRVLPIGGLREKLLAANRGSIRLVIIPKDNEKDLKEVPAEVLRGLTIKLVTHVDEVLPLALASSPELLYQERKGVTPIYQSLSMDMTSEIVSPQPH